MDVRYINPFLQSIKNVFETMINVPFNLGKPYLKNDKIPMYDISGIIGLTGIVNGCVVLSLSKPIALQIASALIGEEIIEVDDDCTDAVGEVANMIAGGAKKEFPGEKNSISVPSIIVGRHQVTYPRGVPIISIPCETNAGRMTIDIGLRESPVLAGAV